MAESVTGKVEKMHVDREFVIIYLVGLAAEEQPQSGEFRIPYHDNDNSNALFSLALAAAANRYDLKIKTLSNISTDAPAEVEYLWLIVT